MTEKLEYEEKHARRPTVPSSGDALVDAVLPIVTSLAAFQPREPLYGHHQARFAQFQDRH